MNLADEASPGIVTIDSRPVVDGALERALVEVWAAVSNAGGAVGFIPPVTADEIAPELASLFASLRTGPNRLVVARLDGRPVGLATLEFRGGEMFTHWAWVKRVQVHPDLQGRGVGSQLVLALHELACEMGLERLFLTVRDGMGLERLYTRLGYRQVATLPRVIHVGPDDYRDEHHFVIELPGPRPEAVG